MLVKKIDTFSFAIKARIIRIAVLDIHSLISRLFLFYFVFMSLVNKKKQVKYNAYFEFCYLFLIRFKTLALENFYLSILKTKLFIKSTVSIVSRCAKFYHLMHCLSFLVSIVFNEYYLFNAIVVRRPASYICSYHPTLCLLSSPCLTFILTDISSFIRSFVLHIL